jgi:hypothetical protein
MQTIFFSLSFTSLIAWILQTVGFYYANRFAENIIFKICAFALLMYLKIYDTWNQVYTIMGLISACYISFYVYYGSCNISNYFCKFRLPNRSNFSLILGIIGAILSYYIIYWSKFPKDGSSFENYNKLSSVYALIIVLFIAINLLKKRDITYGIVILLVMAIIILSRGLI